ncbi:MAG: proton-conducting transporter membrane subunit, partial [Pseudomonadota bacterium]
DLAGKVAALPKDGPVLTVAILFLMAVGMKAAAFPLFFWLPASYHTPNAVVSAVFSGLLTKVGVYALIRVFTLIFADVSDLIFTILIAVSVLTMILGVLGALAESDLRRVAAFTVVSGIGYMLLGLGIGTELALVGALLYTVHSMILSAALFMGSGIAQHFTGAVRLPKLGGLYSLAPFYAAGFLICCFSLAGLPPFSGFWPKFVLVKASLDASQYTATAAVLISGFLTVLTIGKIYSIGFWRERDPDLPPIDPAAGGPQPTGRIASFWAMTALMIGLGLAAGPVSSVASQAAGQLLSPSAYIAVVLPETEGAGS